MWSNDGGTVTPAPHGENTREGHDTYPWGERQRRGGEEIYGIITTRSDISVTTGGLVLVKGAQTGQAIQRLHVQSM